MESEELRLLRENNQMLRYICGLLQTKDNTTKDFFINLMANLISEDINKNKY